MKEGLFNTRSGAHVKHTGAGKGIISKDKTTYTIQRMQRGNVKSYHNSTSNIRNKITFQARPTDNRDIRQQAINDKGKRYTFQKNQTTSNNPSSAKEISQTDLGHKQKLNKDKIYSFSNKDTSFRKDSKESFSNSKKINKQSKAKILNNNISGTQNVIKSRTASIVTSSSRFGVKGIKSGGRLLAAPILSSASKSDEVGARVIVTGTKMALSTVRSVKTAGRFTKATAKVSYKTAKVTYKTSKATVQATKKAVQASYKVAQRTVQVAVHATQKVVAATTKLVVSIVTNPYALAAVLIALLLIIICAFAIGAIAAVNIGKSDSDFSGEENAEIAWNFFMSKGCNEYAAAGILGNLQQESGINPEAEQEDGPGRGIAQWTYGGSRWDGLLTLADDMGMEWTSIEVQLEFIWYELNGGDSTTYSILTYQYGGLDSFINASNIEYAVEAFEKSFERAGKPNMEARIQYAYDFYDLFVGGIII